MEVGDIFIALITVMASWVHAHVQTHQIVYIKYMQFFAYESYLNKAVKKSDILIVKAMLKTC